MVQVSYPGVYIQEVPSGIRTITGVSTSIAAIIGMSAKGPMFQPTTILNFTDYTRVFSDDTSKGELTDQVRQFFLNGGSQAVIVRIASNALASGAALPNAAGSNSIQLAARNLGGAGQALRARVDYNTPSPESTFNLTIYEEALDTSGNGSAGAAETFSNLSLNPASNRFVKTVLEATSQLVGTVTVPGTQETTSFSLGALFRSDEATLLGDIATILASKPGGVGRFVLRVGSTSAVVSVTNPATPGVGNGSVKTAINDAITASGLAVGAAVVATIDVTPTNPGAEDRAVLLFVATAASAGDVRIEPAADGDIAVALGLGTAQGGFEVGRFAPRRPAPNGFVSLVPGAAANVAELLFLASTLKADFVDGFALDPQSPNGISVPSGASPFPAGSSLAEGTAAAGFSLLNLRQNLQIIANMINAATTKWRAELNGLRLALTPLFGNAGSGTGFSFSGLSATSPFFSGASAKIAATSFIGGSDGDVPAAADYTHAFNALDSNVDLYNIMILARTGTGNDTVRRDRWGEASTRCNARRAFLFIDADADTDSIDKVLTEVLARRIGIVKDHAAMYWPRLRVNPDGSPRFIDASGSIAGIMARIDNARGVWKASAGLDADVRGVLGVQVPMSDPENGRINPQAVNAIRVFPNGLISWGARTMDGFDNSGNDDYKYVPVRRLALFLEESLVRGLKFAVFEPNDEPLWAQIRTAVGAFMNTLFRQGAFQGRTQRDAYFVKVDSETTTQNDINLGIVNVIVGFAPLKPAEFVVITIQQKAGQVQV